jgi:hypothetical protein
MQPSPISVSETAADRPQHAARRDERAYRGVTIVAMLWLLASLWLFR